MAIAQARELEKLVKQNPADTRALLRLAEQHVKGGDPVLACDLYGRAGELFVQQGFARRAISAFAQAMECARAQVATHERVGVIARAMSKLYVKEKLVREALATLDASARFLLERGADEAASTLIEERIALDDTEIARVRLAEALFRLGHVDRAADQLSGVFARLHGQGRRDEAIEVAERLLHHRRDIAIARAAAELYLARNRSGDPFLALAKLRICCERDASHVPTLQLLARAFDQAGHGEKATRVRREIDAIEPPSGTRTREKVRDDSSARAVDAGWDDVVVEIDIKRIDPSRASFWPADEGPAADGENSVVSVSLADVELVDGAAPSSEERPASLLETALECIESLVAQGRLDEAQLLVARHLQLRPRNPLLLERKEEIEQARRPQRRVPQVPRPAPRPAPRRDSEKSIATVMRASGT